MAAGPAFLVLFRTVTTRGKGCQALTVAKEETLTRRIAVVAELHKAREPGPLESFFISLPGRLMSMATCLTGLAMVPLHQWKHNDTPELYIIILSAVFVLLGLSGSAPGAVKLASGVAVQFFPARWRGPNGDK